MCQGLCTPAVLGLHLPAILLGGLSYSGVGRPDWLARALQKALPTQVLLLVAEHRTSTPKYGKMLRVCSRDEVLEAAVVVLGWCSAHLLSVH